MLGVTHATSGVVVGTAYAELIQHANIAHTVALGLLTAGCALLPDLDARGSTASRSLGFLTEAIAWLVGKASGGHRGRTHSLIGIAAFTGLAWAGCTFRHDLAGKIILGLLVTIAASSALEALHLTDGHTADLLGAIAAAGVIWHGYGLALIPLATGIGCATHLAGDSLTDSGVMWLAPFSKHRFRLPEPLAFTTASRPETWIVTPLLVIALALLSWHAVSLPGSGL